MAKVTPIFGYTNKDILEIFFSDLKPEAQQIVLDYYKIKKPEDMSLDIFPICTIEMED